MYKEEMQVGSKLIYDPDLLNVPVPGSKSSARAIRDISFKYRKETDYYVVITTDVPVGEFFETKPIFDLDNFIKDHELMIYAEDLFEDNPVSFEDERKQNLQDATSTPTPAATGASQDYYLNLLADSQGTKYGNLGIKIIYFHEEAGETLILNNVEKDLQNPNNVIVTDNSGVDISVPIKDIAIVNEDNDVLLDQMTFSMYAENHLGMSAEDSNNLYLSIDNGSSVSPISRQDEIEAKEGLIEEEKLSEALLDETKSIQDIANILSQQLNYYNNIKVDLSSDSGKEDLESIQKSTKSMADSLKKYLEEKTNIERDIIDLLHKEIMVIGDQKDPTKVDDIVYPSGHNFDELASNIVIYTDETHPEHPSNMAAEEDPSSEIPSFSEYDERMRSKKEFERTKLKGIPEGDQNLPISLQDQEDADINIDAPQSFPLTLLEEEDPKPFSSLKDRVREIKREDRDSFKDQVGSDLAVQGTMAEVLLSFLREDCPR